MEVNVEKLKEYYAEILAKKEEAVAIALENKEQIVAERFELVKEEIEKQVEAELIAEAEKPFMHDIELCESFLVEEIKEEQPEEVQENPEIVETEEVVGE